VATLVGFLVFGVAAAWLLGLRSPLLLLVGALPTGIGLLTLAAHVVGTLGVNLPIVINAVLALAMAALIGMAHQLGTRSTGAEQPAGQRPHRLVWIGAAIGGLLALGVWLAGIGDFSLPPQGNDDIWHGYLIERLTHMPRVTAGEVAPVLVGVPQPVYYYPYGLHLYGALIHEATGVSVAGILDAAWVVHVGLLLPFGLAAVAWRLFPDRPWVAFWSGTLSAGVTVFPYLTNGIAPYTAALAMIPGLLALLLAFLDSRVRVPSTVLALAAIGVFVTHPAGALVAALLGALVVVEEVLRPSAARDLRLAARRLLAPATLAAIGSLPWLLAGDIGGLAAPLPSASVDGVGAALVMFLGLASPWTPAQPGLAILVGVGVAASIASRRAIALSAGLLLFGILFVGVIAGIGVVATVTRPWYGGWPRLLAVVGLIVPVLAGLGVADIVAYSRRFLTRRGTSRSPLLIAVLAVAVGGTAGFGTLYGVARAQSIIRTAWHDNGQVDITAGDIHLLEALARQMVPADKVLNSPRDGSSWMYAFFGATPVLPYPYPYAATLTWSELFSGKGDFANEAPACRKIAESGATYAIVKDIPGEIDDFDIAGFVSRNSGLFTVILRTDTGAIYRVDQEELARCARGAASRR